MKKLMLVLTVFSLTINVFAQRELTKPEASQEAKVSQRIGLTDITISYHSPLKKGRIVWGELVPYNEVWRAGANQNTTISFSSDVLIEGKPISSGTYGLHMIPTEKSWTIIFSKDYKSWGSFFYNEKQDALRVTVTPKQTEMQDWLSYQFSDPQPQSVIATLRWEKLTVPISIKINVPEMVIANMSEELKNINGFFWEGYQQAAAYCIQNKTHLDDASKWIDESIKIQKTFLNQNTKAQLLSLQGKQTEADALMKEAMAAADETQLNAYGYQLVGQGKINEAVEIFKLNVKRYPNSWNVYDSLAEALEISGDKKGAIGNYKTALAKAPENQKTRIAATIKKLEGK